MFCSLLPEIGCTTAAMILHRTMTSGVLRAPLQFFDVTPIGRILSRFSKDIDVIDNHLRHEMSDLLYCFFEVMCSYSYTVFDLNSIYYLIVQYVETARITPHRIAFS